MRGRPYQRCQRSSHPLPFDATDPHQRVRHRRPPHIQSVSRRIRALTVRIRHVLVKTAPERSGVSRRRTHTRPPPRIGDLIAARLLRNGDGLVRGYGSVVDGVTERLV